MQDEIQENGSPEASEESSTQESQPSQSQETSQNTSASEQTEVEGRDAGQTVVTDEGATVNDALAAFETFKNGAPLKKADDQTQTEQTAQATLNKGTSSRDFTGIPEDDIPMFKNMNNEAFNRLKPMFLEHKTLTEENAQLKKDIITANQASTYDNPESYTLSDEYKHHTNNLSLLDAEMNHWQEQLAHIRAGEPWNPLVYNEKGVPVIGEPRDPSVRAESQVMGALMKGHTLQNNLSDKLEELKTSHSNQHKEFLNGFQKTVDELFKGAKKEDLDKAMASKLPMFPRHTHSNPLVKGLATATALIDGLIALLDEEKGKNNVASIKSRTMVNAGPSAGAINRTGNAKTASVGDALKEFEKAKALGLA